MIKNSFLLFLFFILFTPSSLAQKFDSASFHIDWGNFNMTGGSKNSANYKLTDTVGQNAPGKFTSDGYIVKSGFQYIYDPMYPFTFIINKLNINLGSLNAGVASTDTNTISISSPGWTGYQILVHENHPLQVDASRRINNTRCDSNSCSYSSSGLWSSANTYGFGFNAIGINQSGVVTGIGTSDFFLNQNYYRPFADKSAIPKENSQIIMSESRPTKKRSARITYKVNIPATQATGNYQNSITFIAVPKY